MTDRYMTMSKSATETRKVQIPMAKFSFSPERNSRRVRSFEIVRAQNKTAARNTRRRKYSTDDGAALMCYHFLITFLGVSHVLRMSRRSSVPADDCFPIGCFETFLFCAHNSRKRPYNTYIVITFWRKRKRSRCFLIISIFLRDFF